MKRKFIFILVTIMVFMLVSCKPDNNKYAVLKTAFTVDSHIASNFIYQQDSKLKISGECIENGKIIATLYNENEVVVSTAFGIANKEGKYVIEIDTPKGSFKEYSLVLHDSNNRFFSSFYGIKFGEVTLLLGDEIIDDSLPKELTENSIDALKGKLFIYDITQTNCEWVTDFTVGGVSDFIYSYYNILKKTLKYNDMPIAFVNIVFDKTNIINWLPQEEVKDNSTILKYLEDTNQYFENSYEIGQMSYIYNNLLPKVYNYSYSSIIYSAGVNDFIDYSKSENSEYHFSVYSKLLLMTLKNINKEFYLYNNFSIIQAPSKDVENIGILRNIQSKVSKYIPNIVFVPTYDLLNSNNNTLSSQVVERYYHMINSKITVSDVANVIKKYNGDVLSTITLEFTNTNKIKLDINSLVFMDENGQKIKIAEDKIITDNHLIIIDLSYYQKSFENPSISELKYYEISSISYGCENIFKLNTILNDSNLPILPFYISINSLNEVK